jgi:Yip1 domain
MASANTTPAQTPEPESSSSIGRIFGALFAPTETFQSIARKPTWLPPLILISLLSIAVVGIFTKRVGWESYFEKQDAASSRFQQATVEQQRQAIEAQMKYGPPVAFAETVIVPFAGAALLAAIYLAVFNLLGGTKINFKTSLGIVSYAWTPSIISGSLGIVILFLKDPSTVDIQNLVASNAGAYLSSDSPKWLISLLGSLDVFSFWVMILMAIGYSAAGPKRLTFGKALLYILSVWFVYVLVKVGATAAFS